MSEKIYEEYKKKYNKEIKEQDDSLDLLNKRLDIIKDMTSNINDELDNGNRNLEILNDKVQYQKDNIKKQTKRVQNLNNDNKGFFSWIFGF